MRRTRRRYDPELSSLAHGIGRQFHADADGKEFTIVNEQNVTELLRQNRRAANDAGRHQGEWHRVASIPLVIYYGPADPEDPNGPRVCDLPPEDFKRWLNDPDRRAFRTRPGRV
jgi:hypothetical protein